MEATRQEQVGRDQAPSKRALEKQDYKTPLYESLCGLNQVVIRLACRTHEPCFDTSFQKMKEMEAPDYNLKVEDGLVCDNYT